MKSLVLVFLGLIISCNNFETKIKNDDQIIVDLSKDVNTLELSKIFNEMVVVPLESKDICLLANPTKIIERNNKFFILDFQRGLFLFDSKGKFLNQIGNQGKGPGEYLEIRDFIINKEGNILILDFKKILMYNINGDYIKTYLEFDFLKENMYCNPYQFTQDKNSTIYIWSGSIGVREFNSKIFAMYSLKNNKIKDRYFPLNYTLSAKQSQFMTCDSICLISPTLGNDTIYSINENGVFAKYYVKFKNNITYHEIAKNPEVSKRKLLESTEISYDIDFPLETKDWLFFQFTKNSERYLSFYNKNERKTYLTEAYMWAENYDIGRMIPYNFSFVSNNSFCCIMPAYDYIKTMNGINNKNAHIQFRVIDDSVIESNDNFVLMKYILK